MTVLRGRNFLHSPGPTNFPERVPRAMHRSAVLYPSADLDTMIDECCAGLRRILKTEQLVVMYASSGHGAWEAALVNTLSAGDRVIVLESGAFSLWWKQLVEALGIEVDYLAGDWRHGIDADALEAQLAADGARGVKAVLMVHTDTASGVTNDCAQAHAAVDYLAAA